MSKITIPLLMILAAIGFIAMAKLDRDGDIEKSEHWPSKSKITPSEQNPSSAPVRPVEIEDVLSGSEFERRTNRKLANSRLLPISEDAIPISYLWPTDEEDRPAHPELLNFAQRDSFENWKSFADEHIGFFYPDAPGVRVEVIGATDPIPLLGETMRPSGEEMFKSYRVTAGDTGTLFSISLSTSEQFDDLQRDHHAEVFRRLIPSGGGLLRASFLENGLSRRVEILGKGIKVSVLDWPHLAVNEEVYLRMGFGIELAPHVRPNIRALIGDVVSRYGFEAKLGLLDHGSSPSMVLSALGDPNPSESEQATFEYSRTHGMELIHYKIPIQQGYFVGFDSEWRTVSRPRPEEGSIRWMLEKTYFHAGDAGGIGYDLGALTETQVVNFFEHIVRSAPSAPAEIWADHCQVVANLAQHGQRDERVVEIVRARLERNEQDADHTPSLLALQACGTDMAKGTIANHIINRFASPTLDEDALEQIYTLLGYLGRGHPATGSLIDRALCHTSDPVRELGFKFCSWLPQEYALRHLEAGLRDASTEIRRHCADAFSQDCGDPEVHTKLLAARLSEEDDEVVKSHLRGAIERLTGDTTGQDKL